MKILLVDDSGFSRLTVKKHLKKVIGEDHQFLEANCGKEGISVFQQESPDFVFLDLLMPDISGEEVLKEIRKLNDTVFVTVLTSNFQKPVKERLLSLGASLFIEKTITEEKITEIMDIYKSR